MLYRYYTYCRHCWNFGVTVLFFAVDCYNYTVKDSLRGRVPYTVLQGDTTDISAFEYSFWQPIDYFDPTARFPDSKWKPGYFLNIDWSSGDAFTFVIWTEKDGYCKQGRELARNIIRPRQLTPPAPDKSKEVDPKFKFQKQVATKKRKHGPNGVVVYKLMDLDDNTDREEKINDGTCQQVTFVDKLCAVEEENDKSNVTDISTISNLIDSNNSNTKVDTDDDKSVGEDYGVDDVELSYKINDVYSQDDKESKSIGGSHVVQVITHDWRFGNLYLKIKWDTDQTTWESVKDMQADHPAMTAQYLVANNVTRSKRGGDRNLQWAKKTVRDLDRACKRLQ